MSVAHVIPVTHPAATAAPAKPQSRGTAKFELPTASASAKPPAASTAGLLSGASLLAAHTAAAAKTTTSSAAAAAASSSTSSTSSSTTGDATTAAAAVPATINAVVHDHISLNLNKSGATGLTYSASGLPYYLSVSANGELSGTIMAQGETQYPVTVQVSDSSGNTSSQNVLVNVLAHHYSGWNVANVSVVAPQAVSKTVTDAFGKTSKFTYPIPYQNT